MRLSGTGRLDRSATQVPACGDGQLDGASFSRVASPDQCDHTPTQLAVDISPSWDALAGQDVRVECRAVMCPEQQRAAARPLQRD